MEARAIKKTGMKEQYKKKGKERRNREKGIEGKLQLEEGWKEIEKGKQNVEGGRTFIIREGKGKSVCNVYVMQSIK